ncbi:tetratricopeptide repeat protein 9C isoform X2 [Erpetoichthys calabaricus]|uniref:Tetratricopeptide repeat protein 9C n=1 Tax=Erpetoichthys calabaricus TaxID=27687 RepID=A0A8C4SEM1_ERPCA|nr:tetratricopeptide repeat protein 9C isoform X2 [Erpetoichthys calabaricus]
MTEENINGPESSAALEEDTCIKISGPDVHSSNTVTAGAACCSASEEESCSTVFKAGSSKQDTVHHLQEAVLLKAEGNSYYKVGQYRDAIGRYHRALLLLRSLDPDTTTSVQNFGTQKVRLNNDQLVLLRNTQVDCYNNLAACLLQRHPVNYERVKEYSLRVLHRQPRNVKALYRAGVALLELGDPETSLQYLGQACQLQPNDTNVKKYIQVAEEQLHKYYEKEKALYRGMFG